jgi:hypothetical protein
MADNELSGSGAGMRQIIGSSEKVVVKSRTSARSREGTTGAAIISTCYSETTSSNISPIFEFIIVKQKLICEN